jgi:hypothetical protein
MAAACLEEVAAQGLALFESDMRRRVWEHTSRFLEQAEEFIRNRVGPEWWVSDARSYLEVLRTNLASRDYWLPRSVVRRYGIGGAGRVVRRVCRSYAQLMTNWETLHASAVNLKKREVIL